MESVVPKGIENPQGAYNCFINVVIQSLWYFALPHTFIGTPSPSKTTS